MCKIRIKPVPDSKQINLRNQLSSLGDCIPLDRAVNLKEIRQDIDRYKDHFKIYSPRKKGYNRYGLSITSMDGGFSGVPNLDSLREYNQLQGTHFDEPDFRKKTPFFNDCKTLRHCLKPFLEFMGRSHVLRLDKGGFFHPHRDISYTSFRLFITLTPENYVFILNNKKISLLPGQLYYINTFLSHSLFSFINNSFFMVFSIDLSEKTVNTVYENLDSI